MSDQFFKQKSKKQRGFIIPTAAAMFMTAIPVTGLAIDVSIMYMVQSRLQAAVDAGALAGARSLARGNNSSAQVASAQAAAQAYLTANFPTGYLGTSALSVPVPVVDVTQPNIRFVTVNASVNVAHVFLRWFGGTLTTVRAGATATRRDVNVAIVMDRSGSLANSGSCTPLKAAAIAFSDKFAEGRDNVGLITFASSSRVDFALANTFKTSNPSVASTINSVTCTGATNSAQGLWQGYQSLAALNQPAALNVILFFTDGEPTAVTADFAIKATSGCADKTTKTGVFTVTGNPPTATYGLLKWDAPVQPMTSDITVAANSTGCSYVSNFNNVGNDVTGVPVTDHWGNNLNNGYLPVTLTTGMLAANSNATNAQNFQNASVNAADNAAARIRVAALPGNGAASLPNVVIFSIGLGGSGAASDDFLRRVANDPGSSSFSTTAATGLYVYAPTVADLGNAFNRVASEILRLAK